MPGGKGNIKPEDGKQFSSTYQPKKKWTEEKALQVGNDLIKWLKAEDENIFYEDFLMIENNYYKDLICYLSSEFSSFSELMKIAKEIQELKLVKFGVFDKLNSTMTKFVLINNHDWKDKSEIKNENTNINTNKNIELTAEEIKRFNEELENGY